MLSFTLSKSASERSLSVRNVIPRLSIGKRPMSKKMKAAPREREGRSRRLGVRPTRKLVGDPQLGSSIR